MAAIVHHSKVSPPADAVSDLCIPLLFFDMLLYGQPVNHSIRFFESSFSKPQFHNEVIPALKHSLSLTLAHFLPFAGNILLPRSSATKPTVQFHPGQDYVSFNVYESNSDNFNHLTGDHPRDCSDFYELVPQLPAPTHSPEFVKVPGLAIQVTLFPGSGISIGSAVCHMFTGAGTIQNFFRAWAFIHSKKVAKVEEAQWLLEENGLLPFYDRTAFTDINGLDSASWSLISARPDSHPMLPCTPPGPGEKVRSTFVLKKDEIQKLKNFVSEKVVVATHLSSFSVVCAFIWSCFAKSAEKVVPDREPDYFGLVVDSRGRVAMDPPLPANYLGNCCAIYNIWMKHGELKVDEGFVRAAAIISKAIQKTVYNEKGIQLGAEGWPPVQWSVAGKRLFFVAGSPRFDVYDADFGWGRPTKVELLSTDSVPSISLQKSRWVEGGLEIGLSRPKPEMEAFTTVFQTSLHNVCQDSHVVSKI